MKKLLILALSAALCMSSLVACGSKNNETQQESSAAVENQTPEESKTEPKGEPVTVTVWDGNAHQKTFLSEQVAKWNDTVGKEKNIKIEYVYQDSIGDKLTVAYETDSEPDIWPVENYTKLRNNGDLYPMEDIPGAEWIVEKYADFIAPYEGKMYTVPSTATTLGLVYNVQMLKDAGFVDADGNVKPPETWEEFYEYTEKLTDASNKQFGYIIPAKDSWWVGNVCKQVTATDGFYGGYNPKDGTFDFTNVTKMFKLLMKLKTNGYLYPGADGLTDDAARALFGQGGIAMKDSASYDYAVYTEQFPAEIEWAVAPYPVFEGEERKLTAMTTTNYWLISKNAGETKLEAVSEVLNFLYSDELLSEGFRLGINLPIDASISAEVELPAEMAQWAQYAALTETGYNSRGLHPMDLEGKANHVDTFKNEIWGVNLTDDAAIDKIMDDVTARMNAGIKLYLEKNPDYDRSWLFDPEYDTSIK